jgi:hypothetical protein
MSNIGFIDLLAIYRVLQFDDGERRGIVQVADQGTLEVLLRLIDPDNIEDSGLSILDGDPDSIRLGDEITIGLGTPKIAFGTLAYDLNELLKSREAYIKERPNYFIIRDKFAKADGEIPQYIIRYRKVLAFVALLQRAAAYLDKDSQELIFIKDGKFAIPVLYDEEAVSKFDVDVFEKLLALFEQNLHEDQKLVILQTAVISIVESLALDERFEKLLTDLPELHKKFTEGYKLFVADFSYDKVKDELESTKIEYMSKIHKVFSDIQSQLLGIPVATVIVATQMKKVEDAFSLYVNTAVLIGSYVFCGLFFLLCWNQWKTLDVLAAEIRRQRDVMKKDYAAVAATFANIFSGLNKRLGQQKKILLTVSLIVLMGLLIANIFFFMLSKPAIPQSNIKGRLIPALMTFESFAVPRLEVPEV